MRVVQAWQSALNGGDLAGSLRWLADDLVVVVPQSLPHGGRWEGPDGFVAMITSFRSTWEFDGPLSFDLRDAGDDEVLVCATGRVRSSATGRPATISTAELLTVRQAKIEKIDVYYADVAEIVAAVYEVELGAPGGTRGR